jgi:uncharacterized protein (TIGR00725 family)
MGSAADLRYSKNLELLAEETGKEIAKNGAILMFGAEKDCDSLSTAACRGAKKEGGTTIGITYGKGLEIYEKENVDAVVATGLERGGGRETSLVLSCDGIICLNGGSGTLTEMAIAYQANRPMVAIRGTGGWAEKMLAEGYIDARQRVKVEGADTPAEAVSLIIALIRAQSLSNIPNINS